MTPSLLVVLVAGWSNDHHWHWRRMRRFLTEAAARERRPLWTFAPPLDLRGRSVLQLADDLEQCLAPVLRTVHPDRLVVIAHSTGGPVARTVLRRLHTPMPTTALYAGCPWLGTWTAWLAFGRTARDIRPGRWAEEPIPLDHIQEHILFGRYDLIVPRRSATALDVPKHGVPVDHGGLVWHQRALDPIWRLMNFTQDR